MNILLVIGLVLFACAVIWVYILFVTNITNEPEKPIQKETIHFEDPLEHCKKLLEEGAHAELQKFAQKELAKNFGNIEIRRILAQSLMHSGDEQMAIAHFEAILNISPYDLETQELLAQHYCLNGPKSRAIEIYEQILMYDGGNVEAAENLTKLYEETQDFTKAIELYQMLLDAELDEERKTKLEYKLAELYSKVGDSEKAFDAWEKIYKADPSNIEILVMLAELAYKNKYWKDCLKYYKKVIETVGDDFEILEKIAQIYTLLEKWDEAIETYKKIISIEGETGTNYLYHQNELCNAMLKNHQFEEAIDVLKDLMLQYPNETSFAFTLAQAYTAAGEFQIGVNLYNKLLEDIPPEQSGLIIKFISNLICAWAQDLFKKGEYNQAFDKFFEALKYDEENDEVYFELGKANFYIKSYQDAIAHFKRAIAIKPQNSMYYFGLGCAYDEAGSSKNAKVAFYDALNINPLNTNARIAYAISLTKELEYAQSIEQFSEVLRYIPNDADTLYNLALAYELVGDTERAIKNYRLALENNRNHKEAKHNLELLLGEEYIIETDSNETIDSEEILNEDPEEALSDNKEEQIFETDLDLNDDIDNNDTNSSMFS